MQQVNLAKYKIFGKLSILQFMLFAGTAALLATVLLQ